MKSPETPTSPVLADKSLGLVKTHASTTSSKAKSSTGNEQKVQQYPISELIIP